MTSTLEKKLDVVLSALTSDDSTFCDKQAEAWLDAHDISVRLNVVTGCPVTNHKAGLNDLLGRLLFDCGKVYKGVTTEKVKIAIDLIARKNSYNPYLDSIPEWDRKNHFKQLARIIRAPSIEGLWEWLLAVVGMQIMRDVLEFDVSVWRPQMVLLVGSQGCGKDWVLNGIGNGYTNQCLWDGILSGERDELRRAKRCVVASIAEDPTAHGSAIEGIKRFLTLTTVRTRGMYEKFDDDDNALLSAFAGSTNEMSPLRDSTGNRRFCVIDCNRKLRVPAYDFPQLLAQVRYSIDQWLADPTPQYPWLRTDYADNEKRQARFVTVPDVFSDILQQAYTDAPDKTVGGIRDAISDADARRYYTTGRNMMWGLQRLGYVYNGKTFCKKETDK